MGKGSEFSSQGATFRGLCLSNSMNIPFSLTSVKQLLDKKLVLHIFDLALRFEKNPKEAEDLLKGTILGSVFYEASTRTRFSFEAAMLRLGGGVVSTESAAHFSSAIKGESLEDSIRIIAGYTDIIALRHPEAGAAQRAASVSSIPLINAGDGSGEHPTQALLDLFTIQNERGSLEGFSIGIVGDLLYGRTVHSLVHILSLCENIDLIFVCPEELSLPQEYQSFLAEHAIPFRFASTLEDVLPDVDVLYVTRIQKERFSSPELYSRIKDSYVLTPSGLGLMKKDAVIMHPLPRVGEIQADVDGDPRAAYFRQARNGLYVRMALLALMLGRV